MKVNTETQKQNFDLMYLRRNRNDWIARCGFGLVSPMSNLLVLNAFPRMPYLYPFCPKIMIHFAGFSGVVNILMSPPS